MRVETFVGMPAGAADTQIHHGIYEWPSPFPSRKCRLSAC